MHLLGENSRNLIATGRAHYIPNYNQREMILDRGEGVWLYDLDGNAYLDLGAGIAVNALGHKHPELLAALTQQAAKLWHTSNVYYTEPSIRLAEELTANCFAERVFFCNSGSEANEAAIKLARKYASQGNNPDKRQIISFTGGFHGRTLAAVTATAQPKYHQGFEPLPPGFVYCPFNDFATIEAMVNANTCAIMVEPIQGEGGVTPAAPGFLQHLRELCDRHEALLIVDEIQTGVGRTGRLFAHQWSGVTPDIMTLAKALGCGFPIGAVLTNDKVASVLQTGSHGSTFGGNPLATAVGRTALRVINTPEQLQHVEVMGEVLRTRLQELNQALNLFSDIRGQGLMVGAELKSEFHGKAGDLVEAARKEGVLILQAGPNVLRFLPPLIIKEAEINQGIDKLTTALRQELGKT